MVQLRPHLTAEDFLLRVRRMQRTNGYQMAALEDDGEVRAVAGFRDMEMLWRGRFLYVDDLVTDERMRSRGYGRALLGWLCEEARRRGYDRLHLDSGTQRKDAHRFYEREGMKAVALHFEIVLDPTKGS